MANNSNSNSNFTNFFQDFNSPVNKYFKFGKNVEFSDKIYWKLPCSKSHFIRWLFISSQRDTETKIKFSSKIGNDILTCAKVLEKLGVKIIKKKTYWKVLGCKSGDFNKNPGVLNCGNSATTLRFLLFLIARNGINAKIVGDISLSKRDFRELIDILECGGSKFMFEKNNGFIPLTIEGSFNLASIDVSAQKTSQLISGLIITMPSSLEYNKLILKNEIVSRPYFELTSRLCIETGAKINFNTQDGIIELNSWKPNINNEIIIPGESSLVIFPLLFCKLHNTEIIVDNWPKNEDDCLGFEKLKDFISNFGLSWSFSNNNILISKKGKVSSLSLDIKDNIDLITPLILLMSVSGGGSLSGILHAKNKESDRIQSSINLCKEFGIQVEFENELTVYKSELIRPEKPLFVEGDHRLQMSIMILLSFTEGFVESESWYANSDPDFIKRLLDGGVSIS